MWQYATLALAALLCAAPLSAQVVRLEITSREPMSAGQPAGAAGPFELIRGRIHGEIDPKDPHNAIIQDLDLAPRNAGLSLKFVVSMTSVSPSQWPLGSPIHERTPDDACARLSVGTTRVSWSISIRIMT